MYKFIALCVFLLCVASFAQATEQYSGFYGDVVASKLLGLSTSEWYNYGLRNKQYEGYLYISTEWADTNGSDLPYQYRFQGVTAGVGARYWFPGNKAFATLSYGEGVAGDVVGDPNFRAGVSGYNCWEKDKQFSDLYGELFWVGRADDSYLGLRYRPGITLHRTASTRLWTYGVGQLWASGSGSNGTENRAEAGVGLGYLFMNGHMTANADLRVGNEFRGTITERNYFNPTLTIAGSW